jgi:hypothetical protein
MNRNNVNTKGGYKGQAEAVVEDVAGEIAYEKGVVTELSKPEQEYIRMNFGFYDKARKGFIERFELPMILISKSI